MLGLYSLRYSTAFLGSNAAQKLLIGAVVCASVQIARFIGVQVGVGAPATAQNMKTLVSASLAAASTTSAGSNPSRLAHVCHKPQARLSCHGLRPSSQSNGAHHRHSSIEISCCMLGSKVVQQCRSSNTTCSSSRLSTSVNQSMQGSEDNPLSLAPEGSQCAADNLALSEASAEASAALIQAAQQLLGNYSMLHMYMSDHRMPSHQLSYADLEHIVKVCNLLQQLVTSTHVNMPNTMCCSGMPHVLAAA